VLLQFLTLFLPYAHSMTVVMPPGPVLCIGGTKYPHCNCNCNCTLCLCSTGLLFRSYSQLGMVRTKEPMLVDGAGFYKLDAFLITQTRLKDITVSNIGGLACWRNG